MRSRTFSKHQIQIQLNKSIKQNETNLYNFSETVSHADLVALSAQSTKNASTDTNCTTTKSTSNFHS